MRTDIAGCCRCNTTGCFSIRTSFLEIWRGNTRGILGVILHGVAAASDVLFTMSYDRRQSTSLVLFGYSMQFLTPALFSLSGPDQK